MDSLARHAAAVQDEDGNDGVKLELGAGEPKAPGDGVVDGT